MIARRARRLGSRRASHLVDVQRRRSCAGSVHSSGSFCTKLKAWTPRTPLSWFAAGAPDQMPAARRPAMHHSSLCAGAYPQGLRDATGWRKEDVGLSLTVRWARLGCIVLTNTTSPQCLRNPQGREGGQQQQHDRAHETRERILEAFSKRSVSVHQHDARYGNMGGICMHARPDRKVGSPAGALIHT